MFDLFAIIDSHFPSLGKKLYHKDTGSAKNSHRFFPQLCNLERYKAPDQKSLFGMKFACYYFDKYFTYLF